MLNNKTTKPAWGIGDKPYVRESAMIGFLERYEVTGIEYDNRYNRWMYKAHIKHKGTEPRSVIDMYNLRTEEVLVMYENDLIGEREAIELAIINTEERLRYLLAKREHVESI